MKQYADIEIGLYRIGPGEYTVEFRFSHPGDDSDIRLSTGRHEVVHFDIEKLSELQLDPNEYGQILSNALFAPSDFKQALLDAIAISESNDVPLRMRLFISSSAPELHGLRWELLQNPRDNTPIATDQNIAFSRYMASLNWRAIRMHPKGNLRALLVIANPSDLSQYNFASIDVNAEIARAQSGLENISTDRLPLSDQPATLNNLISTLFSAPKPYDILYLVCHGTMIKSTPYLYLEKDDRKMDRVAGQDLVTRIKELQHKPRLIVLASCQSAGKGEGDALTALGPRLAEIGIPAVVAMQDNLSMETAAEFIPTFFRELDRDGQIDRAMSAARGMVRDQPDHWVPVLFMRLKSGRLWYTPGFGDSRNNFEKFPAEVRNIKRQRCTPIIGPTLVEPMTGSLRDIARHWAEAYHYPLAPHERDSLPQVSQFLTINQAPRFPFDELEDHLKKHLSGKFATIPSENLTGATLNQIIDAVGAQERQVNPHEPHKLLAQFPLPIFITTNQDSLLEAALREQNKDPQTVLCPWNDYIEQVNSIFDEEPHYQPSIERPLVYHLFGSWDEPLSVVLTEDNYFDFLIGVTSNKELIPETVRLALADSGLLLLGFQTDEWSFRVLFRSILKQPGGNRRDLYAHIAAQIEPDDDRILQPQRARRYLEQYFVRGASIDIYWGNAQEFLSELTQHWEKNK